MENENIANLNYLSHDNVHGNFRMENENIPCVRIGEHTRDVGQARFIC